MLLSEPSHLLYMWVLIKTQGICKNIDFSSKFEIWPVRENLEHTVFTAARKIMLYRGVV